MTIQYEWTIEDLKMTNVEVGGVAYTDVVTGVRWVLNAVELSDVIHAHYGVAEYGSASFDPNDVDADTFIEFADLGGLKIIEWVVAAINSEDADKVDTIKAGLATEIAEVQGELYLAPIKKQKVVITFNDALLGA